MEVREVEVTKKEEIVTMTKEEYNTLIRKERAYGARKTKQYIAFCYLNYKLKMNLGGIVQFIDDLSKFLSATNDYIENTYGWNFWTWLEHNRD